MQFDSSSSEHDKMAALSYLEYLLQIERNPTAFSGRRVLAAVLMKSPDSSITVLSLGTGKTEHIYLFIYLAFANTDNKKIVRTLDCRKTRQNNCTYGSPLKHTNVKITLNIITQAGNR